MKSSIILNFNCDLSVFYVSSSKTYRSHVFMIKRLRSYLAMDTVTIQVITWNVNTQFPGPATPLAALLPPDSAPDLVLLGLQEVKSQPQNLAADFLAGEDPWTAGLRASLASRGYVKVTMVMITVTEAADVMLPGPLGAAGGHRAQPVQPQPPRAAHPRPRDPVHQAGLRGLLGQQGRSHCTVHISLIILILN